MIGTYVNGYANASLCSAGVPHGYSISGYTLTDKEIFFEMQMNKVSFPGLICCLPSLESALCSDSVARASRIVQGGEVRLSNSSASTCRQSSRNATQ
jgi:hypothetical protein